MTIETKYNIGDKMWFYHNKTIMGSRVYSIDLLVREDCVSAKYLMEDIRGGGEYIVLNEEELFPTYEELLKSLKSMGCRISRTSDSKGDKQPCSNAIKEGIDELGYDMWWLNIDSLDDLYKLIEECGTVIVTDHNEIEIYDSYRE